MPSSYYHRTCQRTKARFFTVLAETTKQRAPTKIVVSGDSTVADEITSAEGFVSLEFDSRTIVMSNHQIYVSLPVNFGTIDMHSSDDNLVG